MIAISRTFLFRTLLACATVAMGAQAVAGDVRFTVAEYSPKTGPYFERVAADFEAANPGININVEVVPWNDMQQRLITDLSANNVPDIAIIGTRWLVDFVANDAVENFDDYMSPEFRQRFIPAFFGPGVLNGNTYGLPVAASARAMFYNKDLLDRAGVSVPQTWEQLVDASRKISALGGGVRGFGMQGKEIETDVYYYYAFWSHGGRLIDSDGTSGLDSAAGYQAAELYKSMIDEGITQDGVTDYTREDVQNLFIEGRLGFVFSLPFLPNQIKEKNPSLPYGVAAIPRATDQVTYGVTDSIVMFSGAKNKPEAWKFLDHAFSDKWRREFTVLEGFLPVNAAVSRDPHFVNDADLKVFSSLLPNARFAPTIEGWEEIAQNVVNALQRVYTGEQDAKTALDDAAQRINRIL
jgi:multiple sugar transport system substrate-binding protein